MSEKLSAAYGLLSVVVGALVGSVVYQMADQRGRATRLALSIVVALGVFIALTAIAVIITRVRRKARS